MYHQFGWWHRWTSWMAMAHFRPVRTIFCLQQLVSAEAVNFSKKNMGIPCLGMVSRACLGRVSACLGMVSRGVLAWLGVVSREKKHDLHLSYTTKRTKAQGTIKSGLPLKKNNKWKYYRSWTPKKQKIKTDYRWEAIKNKADHRSETQRKTKFKSKNDSKSNIF
jgi:hypothetical protein